MTADFLTAKWRSNERRKIDWIASAALLLGCTAPLYIAAADIGLEGLPWVFPCYVVTFVACVVGRITAYRVQQSLQAYRATSL